MKDILVRGLRLISRPLPGWLTLFLFAGALASAAAVLPYFSSGTASFGPGGAIDLGSVDATGAIASPDPGVYNGGGSNVNVQAPHSAAVNLVNCLTSACSGANQQTTFATTGTLATSYVPLLSTPTGISTPAPNGPCFGHTGTPCLNSIHYVHDQVTVAVATSNCLTLTWCTLNGASSITLTGNAVFGGPSFCYSDEGTNNYIIPKIFATSGSALTVNVFNATSGTLTITTPFLIFYDCFGT